MGSKLEKLTNDSNAAMLYPLFYITLYYIVYYWEDELGW